MNTSPTRKRATNGTDEAGAPHFRSVSQLAYINHGHAKAVPTLAIHPKYANERPPVAFVGRSNAEFSYTNTVTPKIEHVSPTRAAAAAANQSGASASPSGAFTANSESRSHYRNHGDCRRDIHRPKGQTIQPAAFRGESESRREYVDHNITTVPPIKHEQERTLPQSPFRGTSTMRESYTGSPVRTRQPAL